jgi:hypothetical protein
MLIKNLLNKRSCNSIALILSFLLFIILPIFIGCTSFPTSPSQTYYGDLQINSEPSGASIYVDGTYTGFSTPHKLEDVASGSLITLKLNGYLHSSNIVQIYPDQLNIIEVTLTPSTYPPVASYMTKIEISPDSFNLKTGEISFIDAITAYYSDGTNRNISLYQCAFSSNNKNIATIYPDGKIIGISGGQTVIWATYKENNITKNDNVYAYVSGETLPTGNLTSIVVLPSSMSLDIGESRAISSITAYYDNGEENILSPSQCSFGANNSVVSVDNSGLITGNTSGNSIVTVTYSDNDILKSESISVSVSDTIIEQGAYRGLAIGVGDYIYYGEDGDLIAPPYDVNKIKDIFYDCQFGNEDIPFYRINELKNTQATKANIFQSIQSTFSGANDNDVSYFYFSGHGATLNQVSYLCPADFDGNVTTAISVNELESALSVIPGIKVVLIDSCHSGGFIGKDISRENSSDNFSIEEEHLSNFNENIIDAFSCSIITKDLLTSSEYQVLTSSHWYQSSYELQPPNEEPFGVFTQALYEGCSLNNNLPADIDMNAKINLNEAHSFISQWVAAINVDQNVQVYPANSLFTIFEY